MKIRNLFCISLEVWNPIKWKSKLSFGTFTALKRFSALSAWLYPQYITWNWNRWKPELTPKPQLIPWFSLSLLVFSVNVSFFWIGLGEILAFKKDPDFSSVQVLFLVYYTSFATYASSIILFYAYRGNAIKFALGNLQILKTDGDGMSIILSCKKYKTILLFSDHPGDMIDLFLYLLIAYPFLITCTVASIPLLQSNIDPTYFWFKNTSAIPPEPKFFLRVLIIFLACFHGAFVFADSLISMVNVARSIIRCFKAMSSPGQKKAMSFSKSLLKLRQLSIVTTVSNQGFYYMIPGGLLVCLVVCCVSAYFVVKLSSHLPLVLSLFSILLMVLAVIFAHVVIPMFADITVQSRNFIYFWKRKECSAHRKRQIKSFRGPFFLLDTQTRGTYLEMVMYNSISLIMSI